MQENLAAKPTSCLFERALGRCRGLLDQAEALLIFPSMKRRLKGCEDVDKTKPLCRTSSEQSIKSLFQDSLHNCLNQAENSGSELLKVPSTLLFGEDKQTKLNDVQSGIQRSNLGPTVLSEGSAILDDRYDRTFKKSPQKSNDDLRAAGTILGLSYSTQDGTLKHQSAVLSWICLLSLAVNGNSVSNHIHCIEKQIRD